MRIPPRSELETEVLAKKSTDSEPEKVVVSPSMRTGFAPLMCSIPAGLVVPMPTLPPLVILILSDQLLPFHAENTMSLVDEPPGCAIPNDTAAVGSPLPPA